MSLNHASLFTGVSGFDLAAEAVGWNTVLQCEINEFCNVILEYFFPKSHRFYDIKKADFTPFRNTVDVVSGGFPCQPYSQAGKRAGTDDPRHLWPENFRALREIQPTWYVGENVRGLTNWNAGHVFDDIQSQMETEGYEVTPFLLPASAVGAPHERYRIFFIAYSQRNHDRRKERRKYEEAKGMAPEGRPQDCSTWKFNGTNYNDAKGREAAGHATNASSKLQSPNRFDESGHSTRSSACEESERERLWNVTSGNASTWDVTDTTGDGLQRRRDSGELRNERQKRNERFTDMGGILRKDWRDFPSESPICGRNDGFSIELADRTIFGKKLTRKKWEEQALMSLGNAVVPQLIIPIFEAIQKYEDLY